MHKSKHIFNGSACLFACILCSCTVDPRPRLNAPPQGEADEHPAWRDQYTYHNDQGMLADMSIADIHFVPHSSDLSGVGQARLERYAELLATSGGTLNYDTSLTDRDLLDQRLSRARNFLTQVVPGTSRVDVVVGLPGGRGMTSKEAIADKGIAHQPEPRNTAYKLNKNKSSGN
jgi:hypothetical protein